MYHYFLIKIADNLRIYIVRVKRDDYPSLIDARRKVKEIMMEFTNKDFIVRPLIYDCLFQEIIFTNDIAYYIPGS